jgi:molecular chaperone DnaJ
VRPGTASGTVQRLRGEGPPKLGGKEKGDIHYRFVIDVPQNLSKEQQSAVDQLSKTFGGDPRAGLFPKNGSSGSVPKPDSEAAGKGAGDGS